MLADASLETSTGPRVSYRDLVSEVTFERLVSRIIKDEGFERSVAEEIMEAALCFLVICGNNPRQGFSPSPIVDIGWHTFILYTREYATFCDAVAGKFIHHAPNDLPGAPQAPGGIQRTIDFMVAHGIAYSEIMWTGRLTGKKLEIVLGSVQTDADCDDGLGPPGNCTCS